MTNPYLIQGPALISFSGGRTSAYMLYQIIQAHGGTLPDDVIVAFANTGKEREETLRFVHECGSRWGVKVHWLEWRIDGYEQVGFNSAARAGEPFAALIEKKGFTPNRGAPFCSIELKGRVMRDFVRAELGWKHWDSIIGLRHDEGLRVMKALARNDSGKEPWRTVMPMAKAKHTKMDVMRFFFGGSYDPARLAYYLTLEPAKLPQGFDLGLLDFEGNCDLCWKKTKTKRERIIRANPSAADWWIEQEEKADRRDTGGSLFDEKISFREMREHVLRSPDLFDDNDDTDFDVECGLHCDVEDAA